MIVKCDAEDCENNALGECLYRKSISLRLRYLEGDYDAVCTNFKLREKERYKYY